jgi:hypothetical protein
LVCEDEWLKIPADDVTSMNVCISDRGGEREIFMEVFHAIFQQRTNESAHASSLREGQQRADYRQTDQPPSRLIGLVILTLIGVWLLAAPPEHPMSRQMHIIVGQAVPIRPSLPVLDGPQGTQAGGGEIPRQNMTAQAPTVPAFCLPTDITCLLDAAMQWATGRLLGIFQPLIDAIDQNPLNFISQTPMCVSACPTQNSPYPQNGTIGAFVTWSIGVADAAVAVFIVLAGYNIMMARQIGASYADVAEFLPRMALAVMAANLCLFFLQFFIDLENALCLEVVHLFAFNLLSTTMVSIFDGHLLSESFLVIALAIILGVMNLLLAWQMLVRLALLFLLIVLAPMGMLCFGLPQTQGYGRLWTSTFAATLFVQFFQVVTLALGGMLISYTQTTGLLNLDAGVVSLLVSTAVISLVLHIPGMIRNWALRPIAQAGLASAQIAGQLISTFAA